MPASPSPLGCAGCGQPRSAWLCAHCGALTNLDGGSVTQVLAVRPHGRTYLARQADGLWVVITEQVFADVEDAAAVQAVDREVESLAGLKHPRLPKLLGYVKRHDDAGALRSFMKMTRVPGTPLDELARARPLTPEQLAGVLRGGLDLLVHIQQSEHPRHHRDLCPAHVLLTSQGLVSLVGFAVARPFADDQQQTAERYIPREQRPGIVDSHSDPYALAMTVLCLLTGRRPSQLRSSSGEVSVPSLPVDRRMSRALQRMLALDPTQRFPDALSARAALDSRPGAQLAAICAVIVLCVGGIVAAKSWREWTARPQAAAAPSSVVARFDGGVITTADVEAEFERLPPVLIDGYPDWRADVVYSLAVQRVAQRIVTSTDAQEAMRGLIDAPGDRRRSRQAFLELLGRVPRPEIVDTDALKNIVAVPRGSPFPSKFAAPGPLEIRLDDSTTLVGEAHDDGTFELALPGSSGVARGFTRILLPVDWLYIELVEPRLTRGNYLIHDTAFSPDRTPVGPTAWRNFPPGPPAWALLAERYPVHFSLELHDGLQQRDAMLAWERVRGTVEHCVRLAAWDQRYKRADVRFDISVEKGVMRSSPARFEKGERLELDLPKLNGHLVAFVRYDQAEFCHFALTRWRFPTAATGSVTLTLQLEGEPWSEKEQAAFHPH